MGLLTQDMRDILASPLSRAEIIRRATELVEPTRAAHPRGAQIRKQFQEDVGHVLDQIKRADADRRVNRDYGSTKPKEVRRQFLRALRLVEQLAKQQPAVMFENWEDPGHKYSSRERFLEHLWLTRERAERYKAPRGPRSGMNRTQAAAAAHWLLCEYCMPVDANKNGIFCQLTALLTGEPHANLQRYCRKRLKGTNRV